MKLSDWLPNTRTPWRSGGPFGGVCGGGESTADAVGGWTEYVETHKSSWRGRKTEAGWTRSIEKHAVLIKNKPVAEIGVDDILLVLQPLWMSKAESAGKLRERIERVLDYAKVKKLRAGENPAMWKGNLIHLLPPRPKLQRGHMLAIPFQQAPALMQRLARSNGMSARALEFTIFTVARETMTLEATWGEVRGDIWELEARRMKERPFRQPLSSGALASSRRCGHRGRETVSSSFRGRRAQ